MEKLKVLLSIVVLWAAVMVSPSEIHASALTVVADNTSGIAEARYTATLEDGTILGFYRSSSTVYFCGAVSQKETLALPDSINAKDWSASYAVKTVGYGGCDFDRAKSVVSLLLPATIENVSYLPSTVKVLHLANTVKYVNPDQLSNLDKVYVPKDALDSYLDTESWRNYVLITAEGSEPLKITVNMTKAGEFAQLLLQQIDNWYKVNELTVVGDLNENDLNVFKRMKQLTKLDLSRAVIGDIPDQFDGANTVNAYRSGFNILETLILPEINKIGEYAFAQCYRLKNVTLPKVNIIGYGAFAQLGAGKLTLPEGISSIDSYAFYYSKIESIAIPSTVSEISNYCFKGCDSLKSIVIPASVTKIGYEAFRESGLTSVSLPGVEKIGDRAFYYCTNLSEVKFSGNLQNIEGEAFYGCTSLTEIDLPGKLLSVNGGAFRGCKSIKKVISRAVMPPTHANSNPLLYSCDMTDVKLYVPATSIDLYRNESGWRSFYTILPLDEKTSYAYIYDDTTIDDAAGFTDNLDMNIDWKEQNRNGYYGWYRGALDYNGNSTLSMDDYIQHHDMGKSNSNDQYSYNAIFTSLIPNGPMRANNVQTKLKTVSNSIWYFISLPYDVKVSDITYDDDVQFAIRKYSGLNRARQSGDTWINLTADSTMHAYEGYILRCNKNNVEFTFPAINNSNKNKVFEKESVVMPLGEYLSEFEHNRSWNLIGNPYPCYYDTRFMDFTAPITVWNRYYSRYDAYSPIDDSYILHPAQSFFVQRPVGQGSITFDKSGRQKNAVIRDTEVPTAYRKAPAGDTRKIFNVILSDGENDDRARFVINSSASCAYELDKDASKFVTDDNTSMLVYTIENGVRYAINERPLSDGIVHLGFYAPHDGEYVMSVDTRQMDKVLLTDKENNKENIMTSEYRFNANAGYNDVRFTLTVGETTGIDAIISDGNETGADGANAVYTTDGRLVGHYSYDEIYTLPKGIYIVSSKEVKRKIVVK